MGAVVGAVKASAVRRESPAPGDVILLLGGRTGRDGIGGATGSSKEHTEASLETCGSEVQKGNAPEERKLQHLMRRPDVTKLIKKSNDFGAGGVSVAIGELADGLDIYLDRVPVKYSGLNSTELAISESQERMAVVVEAKDMETFKALCDQENVEVTHVADVTDRGRMRMYNNGEIIADLSRSFIDSAGAVHYADASIQAVQERNPFTRNIEGSSLADKMATVMGSANVASQKGLGEMFDASIGRSTVLMPYGGKRQLSETQVSVQKLPTDGYTDTASVMAYGYDPELSSWSPYHGAAYAVIEACTKVVASGGKWSGMRFSYQEYFERMTSPHSWGKPLSALLGALKMQRTLGLPSIGGKDSMSGTFEDISVPPTLIAFGITTVKASKVISTDFKQAGNKLYLIRHTPLANYMPDTEALKANWDFVNSAINDGSIVSSWSIGTGGVAEALVKMGMGNALGAKVKISEEELFCSNYGSLLVEATKELSFPSAILLGEVAPTLEINGERLDMSALEQAWAGRYSRIYPTAVKADSPAANIDTPAVSMVDPHMRYKGELQGKPLVFIPIFPGSNCDYDTAKAFRKAGARVEFGVFRNLTPEAVLQSIDSFSEKISRCQILALCGGFSAGDEPDGSGKFIANVLNNVKVAEQIHALLERNGLILGICNGFQALVKSGLLPYGRLGMTGPDSPTLFRNDIGRHISQMVSTRVAANNSVWLKGMKEGELHSIAVSHGEGKFTVNPTLARKLFERGQIAFQYADPDGKPTIEAPYNPNGSYYAIEGITSPDGKILGKMGHSERSEKDVFRNISGNTIQPIFENAVNYFLNK